MTEVKKKSERSDVAWTPEWRTAYPFLHERREKRADGTPIKNPSFDMTVIAPKTNADPALCSNYKILADHCFAAARKMWPGSVDAAGNWVWPAGARWPILDGDVPYKAKAPPPGQPAKVVDPNAHAWRKGHWQIEVSHFLDPGPRVAVMQNGQAVEIPAKAALGKVFYKSGDYAMIELYAWAYERETFGVNYGVSAVLFTKDGETIGSLGPRTAQQIFGAIAPVGQLAAPVAGPQTYAPMPTAPPTYAAPTAPLPPALPAAPTAPLPPALPAAAAPPVAPAMPGSVPGVAPMPQLAPAGVPSMPMPPIPGR